MPCQKNLPVGNTTQRIRRFKGHFDVLKIDITLQLYRTTTVQNAVLRSADHSPRRNLYRKHPMICIDILTDSNQ